MDSREIRIPKTIHYCWFGRGEKPEIVKKCIDTWKDKLSDYEIIEWNEDNFDINQNDYVTGYMCKLPAVRQISHPDPVTVEEHCSFYSYCGAVRPWSSSMVCPRCGSQTCR